MTTVDPVDNTTCDPGVCWTSGNVAEAFPGVCTPLGFTFMHDPVELALRTAFANIGALRPSDIRVPPRIEEQYWSVFAGRAAANMDRFRDLADRVPGTSATAVERQLFGYVRPGTVDHNTYRRYPAIVCKAPRAVIGLPKRHDAEVAGLRAWRSARLATVASLDIGGCRALLAEARSRFGDIMVAHFLATFVSSGMADRLIALADAADDPGLGARLLSGVGSDENAVAADLWSVAQRRLDLSTFLDRHGYHGQSEGQLDVASWREDPTPIEARLDAYRSIGPDDPRAPARRSAAQAGARADAVAELTTGMARPKAGAIRGLVGLTARFVSLREQGKAGYLICFDVARAAARRLGEHLVDAGVIDVADDVFFLTWDEVMASRAAPVSERRSAYAERHNWRLPESWTGVPTLVAADGAVEELVGALTGLAAGSGIVEGRARVVTDPGTTDLDEGDILVCEATDPSWISLFMMAGGVVTDLGGMLSHGAIVAREMGLPCVAGTKVGTRRIRDGQLIRVDGDRGLVEIVR